MLQTCRIKRFNQKGFTLLESLLHLIIFIMFTTFIGLFYSWMNQLNSSIFLKEHVSWELFTYDFRNYLEHIAEIKIDENGRGIEIVYTNSEEKIQINQIADVIRKQVERTGHVPMLIGVKDVEFSIEQEFLKVRVEFIDGLKKERTFFVPGN